MQEPAPDVPPAAFDWRRYGSATLAGLTPIIPLPLLDDFVEHLLARRVPAAVADARGQTLSPAAARAFKASDKTWSDRAVGCLMMPIWFLIKLPLKLFKKVLFFLLVRSVANKLAEHWSRAYLIDVALQRGDLDDPASAERSAALIRRLVQEADEPLVDAGKQVFRQIRRLPLRSLLRKAEHDQQAAQQDDTAQATRQQVDRKWNQIARQLETLGHRYAQQIDRPTTPRRSSSAGPNVSN